MKVLGVVTARGGSKGIPRKNLAPLLGKPLLAWTAETALAARRLSRVILSTDCPEIAAAGKAYGLEVPFRRPAGLARDDTPTVPVLQHALRWVESQGDSYDAVFLLQPTNPLRTVVDIDGSIEMLERTGADSVISFADVGEKHPARMKFVDERMRVSDPPFAEAFEGQPRQQLAKLYIREGSVYVTRRDVLVNQNSLKGRDCRAWIVSGYRACNVDTEFDLFLAGQILSWQRAQSADSGVRSRELFAAG